MKKFIALMLCAAVAVFSAGCVKTDNSSVAADDGQLDIVATIFPPYDFARQITGDKAKITMLLPTGSESHTYEPTLNDIANIQNCDVFIYVGGSIDGWAEDIIDGCDTRNMQVVKLLDVCDPYLEEVVEGMTAEEEESAEADEHVWTSPENAVLITKAIEKAVCKADPKNAENYEQTTDSYINELKKLDNDFSEAVKSAKRNTLIFADRFPFRYFTEHYNLNYSAALSGCSSDTEPTLTTLHYLIDKVNEEKIPVVLYIEFSNETVASKVCAETGAKAKQFHSCHNISKEESKNGASYISLMRENLSVLKEALN